MADGLAPAIDILDQNLNILWSNTQAKKKPASPEQQLIIKWLRADIDGSNQAAARRLDWDGGNNCFLESRLFRAQKGKYWLARDWRDEDERPYECRPTRVTGLALPAL